jgi:hypothetical protein
MRAKNRLAKRRRHADISIKEIFGKASLINNIFDKILSAWESTKKITVYAKQYAKQKGLHYVVPVTPIATGDGVMNKIKALLSKLGPAIRNFSFMLVGTILKQILDLILFIPKIIHKMIHGNDADNDDVILEMLDKKSGKFVYFIGKATFMLNLTIKKMLEFILKKTVAEHKSSFFDPNDGNTIEIDSKYGKARRKRKTDAYSYFSKRFSDDLTVELKNFFKNISLIATAFKSGEITQGHLMLTALGRMILVSVKNYKSTLKMRFLEAIKHGGFVDAIKTTAHEIIDIKRLTSDLKKLYSIVGSKGKDILKEALVGLLSMLREGISFANKIRSKNKNGMLALSA